MALSMNQLPAGDYLIIDPCYVYSGPRWDGMSALLCDPGATGTPVRTDPVSGCRFAASFTRAGDGVYFDDEGTGYGVDSGTLACLPLAMIDAARLALLPTRDRSLDQVCQGHLVTFGAPVVCAPCDEEGIIRFGPVVIQT